MHAIAISISTNILFSHTLTKFKWVGCLRSSCVFCTQTQNFWRRANTQVVIEAVYARKTSLNSGVLHVSACMHVCMRVFLSMCLIRAFNEEVDLQELQNVHACFTKFNVFAFQSICFSLRRQNPAVLLLWMRYM